MIVLDSTSRSVELLTSSAVSVDCIVSYDDVTSSTFVPGSQQTNIATATTTTICSAPAASTQRRVQSIIIRNRDASSNQTVTLKYDVSGTEYHLTGAYVLGPGEHVEYTAAQGIRVFDAIGREKCCDVLAIVAGTGTYSSGTLSFSNTNGVSFGIAGGSVITASINAVPGGLSVVGSSIQLGTVVFSNSNNFTFGMNGSTVTGSYTVPTVVNSGLLNVTDSASSVNASRLMFSNVNGLTLGVSTGASIATITGSYTVPTVINSGLVNVTNSVSSVNASRLQFSNANNVTFLVSTAASAATISASVASSLTAVNVSAGATSANLSALTFSNSNGLAFGLTNSVITGSYTIPVVVNSGLIQISDSVSSVNASRAVFSNVNGVSFGINTAGSIATITASIAASSENIIAAGTQTATAGTVVFSNSNNVTFGMSGSSRVTAQAFQLYTNAASSVQATALQFSNAFNISFLLSTAASGATLSGSVASSLTAVNLSAGTTSSNLSAFTFSDSNGLAFGLGTGASAGVVTGSYTVPAVINSGLLNITNSVSSVNASRLLFSNANNVSWLVSTAGSIATVSASVASSLTAINISAGATSANLSNLTFSNSNGLAFGLTNSVITGSYTVPAVVNSGLVQVSDSVSSVNASRMIFSNQNGVTFGINTAGSIATVTASINAGAGGVAISASNSSVSNGTVVFSNLNNLSFGLNGSTVTAQPFFLASEVGGNSENVTRFAVSDANGLTLGLSTVASGATLTGSYTVPVVVNSGLLNITNSASSVNASRLLFSNANNVSWLVSTAGSIATVSASVASSLTAINLSAGTTSSNLSAFTFANSNGLAFGLSTGAGAGIVTGSYTVPAVVNSGLLNITDSVSSVNASRLLFSNANGVSFGINTAGSIATLTASIGELLGLVSHIGGNSVADVTRLAFSNASNVTFSLSTAAGAATLLASVAAGGAGGIAASAAGNSVSNGTVVWSNSNNMSFGMAGSTITGQPFFQVSDPATSNNITRLVFSQSNGLTLSLSTGASIATLVGSYTVPAVVNSGLIQFTNSVSSVNASRLVYTNGGNIVWGLSTAASGATLSATAALPVAAGAGAGSLTQLSFVNSSNMSWGLAGSTITGQPFFLASHIGGNSANVTNLAFSNANNVTFSLSTAASGATVIASVAAPGGGGTNPTPPPGIVLSATNHIIEVDTSTTSAIDVQVSFEDLASGSLTPGSSTTTITTATTTTVQAAPGASTQRTITNVTIVNRGATNNVINVIKDIAGTEFTLVNSLIMGPSERLEFTADMGWRHFDANGAEVTSITTSPSGADFYHLGRADSDIDSGGALSVIPQFNWSADRVAHHADFYGTITKIPIDNFRPFGDAKIYKVSNEVGHFGILRILMPLGKSGGICMGDLPNELIWDPDTLLGFRVIINLRTANPSADYDVFVGFVDDLTTAQNATVSAVGIATANSGGNKWFGITRAASTQSTITPASPSITPGNWDVVEMYNTGGTWELFINGASKGSVNTNVPTALLNFGVRVADDAGGTTDFTVDIDSLTVFTDTIGQRFT